MGILPDNCIPDGPVHVMATPTDETLDKAALSSTVHVRVTSSPKVMGLFKSLVTVTMIGSGTACGTHVGKYIIIIDIQNKGNDQCTSIGAHIILENLNLIDPKYIPGIL